MASGGRNVRSWIGRFASGLADPAFVSERVGPRLPVLHHRHVLEDDPDLRHKGDPVADDREIETRRKNPKTRFGQERRTTIFGEVNGNKPAIPQ
jgi:hypothetical protein